MYASISFLPQPQASLVAEKTLLFEVLGDDNNGLLDTSLLGVDVNLRLLRCLVRCADTSEILDYTGPGLLVKTLGISLLGLLNRNINKDLDERQSGLAVGSVLVHLPRLLAIGLVRADERSQRQARRIGKQLGHLTDTADVLVSGLLVESEILVQAETHIVTVQTVGAEALLEKVLLECCGDGGLS